MILNTISSRAEFDGAQTKIFNRLYASDPRRCACCVCGAAGTLALVILSLLGRSPCVPWNVLFCATNGGASRGFDTPASQGDARAHSVFFSSNVRCVDAARILAY